MASELKAVGSHCWRTVSDGRNSFEVQIRLPSYDDLLHDYVWDSQSAFADLPDRMQIERERIDWKLDMVTGWRDVIGEDGLSVPFTRDDFHLLIVAHPRAMLSILSAVDDLSNSDLSDADRKN